MKGRRLGLGTVIADPVVAAWRLEPRLPRLVYLGLGVIRGAEDGAGDDVADHGGGAVRMGGRRAIGGVINSETDDRNGGVVSELVGERWGDVVGGTARIVN